MLGLVLSLCLFVMVTSTPDEVVATVFVDRDGVWSIKNGVTDQQHGVAYGSFEDLISTTGWSHLNVRAGYGDSDYSDAQLMYAAGYLEGALTARRISEYFDNRFKKVFGANKTSLIEKVKLFFKQQEEWMIHQAEVMKQDPFWTHVMLIYQQFCGLVDGYAAHHGPNQEMDRFAFQFLNADGDLADVIHAIDRDSIPDWNRMTAEEMKAQVILSSHCSALIKVLPGYEDILAGHASWNSYISMMRVYKHYDFNLSEPTTSARGMSFASYPACLESGDDFYVLGSGMVMLQTSLILFDTSLYDEIVPEALFAWQRVRVACQAAHNTSEWMDFVARYNSGTYNNQYMILDLNKVKLKETIMDGALGIVEQLPGCVVSHDHTAILREGYWASYNVPFSEEIYKRAGYPLYVNKTNKELSYQLSPRAEIFRRDQGKVVGVESLMRLLYYNNYTTEEYAHGDPCNTVCCRGDLETHALSSSKPFGCYDVKVTNYSLALQRAAYGISSPTTEGGLPPFSFTGAYEKEPHLGMPILWNFDCVSLKPNL